MPSKIVYFRTFTTNTHWILTSFTKMKWRQKCMRLKHSDFFVSKKKPLHKHFTVIYDFFNCILFELMANIVVLILGWWRSMTVTVAVVKTSDVRTIAEQHDLFLAINKKWMFQQRQLFMAPNSDDKIKSEQHCVCFFCGLVFHILQGNIKFNFLFSLNLNI